MYHYDNESTVRIIFSREGRVLQYEKWDEDFGVYFNITSEVIKFLNDVEIARFKNVELTATQFKAAQTIEKQFETASNHSQDDGVHEHVMNRLMARKAGA